MRRILDLIKSALDGSEKDYTKGSINRAIVLLSIPMVLEMLMEALFAVVDVFFVAKIGTNAIATVGLTETVITIIYSLAVGLSMAASAMVARRVGEKKPEEAAEAAVQGIWIGLVFSVLLGVVGAWQAPNILRLMGGSEELIAEGVIYARILLGTNMVIMMLFLLNGIFRGAGDASLAMRSLWLANGLNIILDPILIFGWGPFPEMGLAGAAIATSIGRGIGVLYQLYILFNGKGVVKVLRKHLRIQTTIIVRLLRVAVGGTSQHLIASASWIFLMAIISNFFGEEIVAGYTVAIRLVIFTILPSWGMANAAATLVGQNLGAGLPERAEKSVWRAANFNVLFLVIVSFLFFFEGDFFIGLLTDGPTIIEAGATCLRVLSIGYVFFAYGMVVGQAFNGAGDTRTPTFINFICFWMVEIPLSYLLAVSLDWGPSGVYWSIAISETLLAVLCILVFRRGRWKLVEI
ncbi:MAG: MATE family efflux transporter [Bacteroidota bacterium]